MTATPVPGPTARWARLLGDAKPKSTTRALIVLVGCGLVIASAAAAAVLTSTASDWQPLQLLLVLVLFNFACEGLAVVVDRPNGPSLIVTSTAPMVLSMTLLGPAPAAAIAAASLLLYGIKERSSPLHVVMNLASYGSVTVVGGLMARGLSDLWSLSPDDPGFALLLLGVYVFAMEATFFNNGLTNAVVWGDSLRNLYDLEWGWRAADGITALLAAATAYVYGSVGIEALGLLIVVQLTYQYQARGLMMSRTHARQLKQLSESPGRLVGQVLRAEENERRRLAESLHHEALQELVFAQGLVTSENRKSELLGGAIGRAVDQLRATIFDLHPAVLRHAGLKSALEEVCDHQSQRAGFQAELTVDPHACGLDDELLFVLAREQLSNAAKHANATAVKLSIGR